MYPKRRSHTEETTHEGDYRHIKEGTHGRGLRIEGTLQRGLHRADQIENRIQGKKGRFEGTCLLKKHIRKGRDRKA